VQLKSNFTVLDVDDQIRLLKRLLQAENIDDKRWPARMLAGLIDSWKNRGSCRRRCRRAKPRCSATARAASSTQLQERLKILNAADFGDLLLENIRLFREHPDVLRNYQNRFKFILVDEYQDTNVAQYLWLRLLAQAPASSLTSPACGERSARKARRVRGSQPQHWSPRRVPLTPPSPASGAREKIAHPNDVTISPQKISAASAMTTSRSSWRAAKSTTSCASSTIFRRQGCQAGAHYPLHWPHPRRRLASDRAQ